MACPFKIPMMGERGGRFKNCPAYFTAAQNVSDCVGDNGGHEFISSDARYRKGTCLPPGSSIVASEDTWNEFKNNPATQAVVQQSVVQDIIDKWKGATPDADPIFIEQYSHPTTADNLQIYSGLVDECSGVTTVGCPSGSTTCPKINAQGKAPNGICRGLYDTDLIQDEEDRDTLRDRVYQKTCDQCHTTLGGGNNLSLDTVNTQCPGCACILRQSISEYKTLKDQMQKQHKGIQYRDQCWFPSCDGKAAVGNKNLILSAMSKENNTCPDNQICQQLNQISFDKSSKLYGDMIVHANCEQSSNKPQPADPSAASNPQPADPSAASNPQPADPSAASNPQPADPSATSNPQPADPSASDTPQSAGPTGELHPPPGKQHGHPFDPAPLDPPPPGKTPTSWWDRENLEMSNTFHMPAAYVNGIFGILILIVIIILVVAFKK
jgi:hypothetical protein